MKLWIDDIRNAPDDTWSVARTATAAIRAIKNFDFDTISLDHDISHQVTVGTLGRPYPCEETFMAVAYYICEKYWREKKIGEKIGALRPLVAPTLFIHSANTPASFEMEKLFRDHGLTSERVPQKQANRLEQIV